MLELVACRLHRLPVRATRHRRINVGRSAGSGACCSGEDVVDGEDEKAGPVFCQIALECRVAGRFLEVGEGQPRCLSSVEGLAILFE